MEQTTKNFYDYLGILDRRKFYILITWLLITPLAVIVAYNLPKKFRSTATLLMQSPMPSKLSESPTHIYADEQIQTIFQKVLTGENVLAIVKKHNLFLDYKEGVTFDNVPHEDLAKYFRDSLAVELATTSLAGRDAALADIVFNVSFSYEDPKIAKEVVAEIARLMIELNDKTRTERAVKITDFLQEELEKLNQKNQELDNRIAQYKEENILSLPDQLKLNMASMERTESELRDVDSQIRNTKDKIVYLEAELARAQSDFLNAPENDKKPKTKEEKLHQLQAKYAELSSIYSPSHPDIIRIKRELKALGSSAGLALSKEDIIERLNDSNNELRLLKERYSENHPEIVKRTIEINNLEKQLKNAKSAEEDTGTPLHTTNPAYLTLEVQYKTAKSELGSLIQKQEFLKSKLENIKKLLSMSPKIEVEYDDMIRERDSNVKKYNQLKEKWLDAKLVQTMEEQQQGHTLSILEPPNLPIHPEKAIRKKVAIGGSVFGLIAGLGLAFLLELISPEIRGYRSVIEATGLTPLIVIPYIESPSEQVENLHKNRKKLKLLIGLTIFVIFLLAVFVLYNFGPDWVNLSQNRVETTNSR